MTLEIDELKKRQMELENEIKQSKLDERHGKLISKAKVEFLFGRAGDLLGQKLGALASAYSTKIPELALKIDAVLSETFRELILEDEINNTDQLEKSNANRNKLIQTKDKRRRGRPRLIKPK